jgi:hypothetical protein
MSDSNLTEKMSETITTAFKKTKLFEKIGKIEFYVGSFIIISSIFTLTNMYMNYSNMNKIKHIEKKIEGSENKLKHNIEINRMENSLCNHKIVKYLKHIKSDLDDTQQKIMEKIMEINMLFQISKKELISIGTSMSDLPKVRSIDSIDGWNDSNNEVENIKEMEDFKVLEDNELLNECYDSIPLNNLKKNTSSWFI